VFIISNDNIILNSSSNDLSIVKSIKSRIAIDFDNKKQAKIIHDSVLLEFESSPDYRSQMTINLENNSIIIAILSEDATSFRASINSAIKLINLSLKVNKLVGD
jgi:KEOPS complex subunit Pcc1